MCCAMLLRAALHSPSVKISLVAAVSQAMAEQWLGVLVLGMNSWKTTQVQSIPRRGLKSDLVLVQKILVAQHEVVLLSW